MRLAFKIRPARGETGFDLACEEAFSGSVRHRRLMDAIVQAVHRGRGAGGEIQIFDSNGKIVDVLPLPDDTRVSLSS